jgi:hypothetical protein
VSEPGVDLHEWESAWASVEEDLEANPAAALSQFADLVEQVLRSRRYDLGDPVAESGDEPEIIVTYRAARETAERAELGESSRAEIGTAIDDLRVLFDTLKAARP